MFFIVALVLVASVPMLAYADTVTPDPSGIVALITSDQGRMVAAGVLFLIVLLLKSVPSFADKFKNPWAKRGFTFGLAFFPLLAMNLAGGGSVSKAIWSAVTIFITAHGVHHLIDPTAPDTVLTGTLESTTTDIQQTTTTDTSSAASTPLPAPEKLKRGPFNPPPSAA